VAITRFRPEIWSANLLVALRKQLVYAGPQIVNHDYEGEIAQAGDTVRITSISRPTIGTYTPGVTTINPEQLTDAQKTLVVDQAKYFAFEVDDVDARQARGNVIPQAMSEAAYGLADVIDQFVANLYTGTQSANALGSITVSIASPGQFYDNVLVPLKIRLDKANVASEGRYVVVTPDQHGVLLRDPRFIKVNESGDGGTALRNGMVGRAAGFDILLSNNAPNTSGSEFVVQAGVSSAISMAMQINKTEAYRPQDSFSDAVKGLTLYGAKVIRPDSLATALVTVGA
jgi:N4-gp56 family major capsid protein